MPKSKKKEDELSTLVDSYVASRNERLSFAKVLADYERAEKERKQELIKYLIEHKLTAAGGSLGIVKLQTKVKPQTEDWEEVYRYIKQNDAFDLLQRRLTETAVKLRWEDGIKIPGIGSFEVSDLTISGVPK